MIDQQFTLQAREWMLAACGVTFFAVCAAILLSHWMHHRRQTERFHKSSLAELGWTVAPMLMVFATGLAGASVNF
jgi:heme/copper-type cytochrome/quinol oxidase subunit 2